MKIKLLISAMMLALLSACASTPSGPNPALADARNAVAAASRDEDVVRYAPVELKQARETLASAQSAWEMGDVTRAEHLAYLAQRHAQIAQAKAVQGEARIKIEQAEELRNELVLQSREQELQESQSEIEELREQLSELNPRQTDRGIVLTIGNVLFAFDSSNLSAAAVDPLNTLAAFLRERPDYRVRVEGYTDSVGSETYNQQLSERRAQSVANAMSQRGVDPTRMTVVGYGEANPVAPNNTEYGRQQNRRVNFVILNAGNQDMSQPGPTTLN